MNRRKPRLPALVVALPLGAGLALGFSPLVRSVAVAAPTAARAKVATIPVAGMTCGGCAANITAVLDDLDGVTESSVDLKKAQAVVHFDAARVTVKKIIEAIESVGYEPGKPVVEDA